MKPILLREAKNSFGLQKSFYAYCLKNLFTQPGEASVTHWSGFQHVLLSTWAVTECYVLLEERKES